MITPSMLKAAGKRLTEFTPVDLYNSLTRPRLEFKSSKFNAFEEKKMNIGQLDIEALDQPYYCVIQLRHQTPGVLHTVILRPDKVTQTMRQCSLGHSHKSAVIVLGESPGDQAAGWQYPENVYVVAILGVAVEKDGKWECIG